MKEEEIIKRLKNIIEINKSFLSCDIQKGSNIYKDIQGLLNLYENKKLDFMKLQAFYEKDYIRKDKIREKIEELSGMNEIGSIEREIYNKTEYAIETLIELLEESE